MSAFQRVKPVNPVQSVTRAHFLLLETAFGNRASAMLQDTTGSRIQAACPWNSVILLGRTLTGKKTQTAAKGEFCIGTV